MSVNVRGRLTRITRANNWIKSTLMKGMTTQNASYYQIKCFKNRMGMNGVLRILRTRWIEATMTSQVRTDAAAIYPDQFEEDPLQCTLSSENNFSNHSVCS